MRGIGIVLAAAVSGSLVAAATEGLPAQLAGISVPGFAVRTLPAAQFRHLHAAAAPKGERWEQIPWETDLAAARQRAAREQKPLFMWVMDGHPLGCT